MFSGRVVLEIELTQELLVVVHGKSGRSYGNLKYRERLRSLVGGPSMNFCLVGQSWQIDISRQMEGALLSDWC